MNKKNNKWLIVLIGLVAGVLLAYSALYYKTSGGSIIEIVFLCVHNVFKAFGLDPSIIPSEIFPNIGQGESFELGYYIYAVFLFLAPLCTATVIWKAVHKLFVLGMKQWKYRNYENVLIFGYNDKVKNLIHNANAKDQVVFHIFSDKEISSEMELELIYHKIHYHRGEFTERTAEKLQKIFTPDRINKITKILLFEEVGSKNMGIFFALSAPQYSIKAQIFHSIVISQMKIWKIS